MQDRQQFRNIQINEAFNVKQPEDHNSIDYKLWVNIKKAGGQNYKYSFLIWTWFQNDKQSLLDQKQLEEIYSTKFNTSVLDQLDLYNVLSKAFLDAGIKTVKLELNRQTIYFKFNGDSGLRQLKSANQLKDLMQQLSQKKKLLIGDEQYDDGEFAFNAIDKDNIQFFGKSGDVICFCTKTFESTNKFIYQLWHDPNMETSSHGNGEDDSACKVNSPFCTRMKKHWTVYSHGNPDYEQFWFFLDPGIPSNISKHTTLANSNCWDAFQMLNNRGYQLLIGLTDTYNDNNNRFDAQLNGDYEKMKDINDVSRKNEIEKLLNGHIVKTIEHEDGSDMYSSSKKLYVNMRIYSKEQLNDNKQDITQDVIQKEIDKIDIGEFDDFELHCENLGLTSIDGIDFSKVNVCYLNGNKIQNAKALATAKNLSYINLCYNELTSLEGIPITNYTQLYLFQNPNINDFSQLKIMPRTLMVGGDNIDESIIQTIPKVKRMCENHLIITNSPRITNIDFLEKIIDDSHSINSLDLYYMNSIKEFDISYAAEHCRKIVVDSCLNIEKIYCDEQINLDRRIILFKELPKLNFVDDNLYDELANDYANNIQKGKDYCSVQNCKLLEQQFIVEHKFIDRYSQTNLSDEIEKAKQIRFDMKSTDFLILYKDNVFTLNSINKIDLNQIDDNTFWDVLFINPKIEEATKFITGVSLDKNSTIYNQLRTILNNFKTKNISFIDAVQQIRKLKNNNLYEWYGSKQLSEYPNSMQALISKQQSQEQEVLESILKALFRKQIII